MSLRCGIIGLTNVGKTTLFNCGITGSKSQPAGGANKANIGVINVPDARLYELEKYQSTQKIIHTTVEMVDIPGLTRSKGDGAGNRFLADVRNTDALIHVLRCFEDDTVPHIDATIDPVRDMETIELELQIKDLESVEKKIQKLEKAVKIGDKDAKKGLEVLQQYKNHFESFQSARTIDITEADKKYVSDLFLLSDKPIIYVCNVDEASAAGGNQYSEKVLNGLVDQNAEILVIAAAAEAEIAQLEDPEDRRAFLTDVGLTEPGINKLIRAAYHLLNLQTFFTVGPKEIRAWTIKKGMTAPLAAGVIHSDLERGFIRAEVMKYKDFISLGSEAACRDKGKLSIEGKNYIVQDGDILNIRFNV
jgi:ribosome-binding ATPase